MVWLKPSPPFPSKQQPPLRASWRKPGNNHILNHHHHHHHHCIFCSILQKQFIVTMDQLVPLSERSTTPSSPQRRPWSWPLGHDDGHHHQHYIQTTMVLVIIINIISSYQPLTCSSPSSVRSLPSFVTTTNVGIPSTYVRGVCYKQKHANRKISSLQYKTSPHLVFWVQRLWEIRVETDCKPVAMRLLWWEPFIDICCHQR